MRSSISYFILLITCQCRGFFLTRKYFYQSFSLNSNVFKYESKEPEQHLTYEDKVKSMKQLTFVSSNPNKIKEVNMILGGKYPWELRSHNFDLTEPQATPIEVSRAKCAQAALLCDSPVIVEDTSLCFNALNGLPGPYIKWFYEAIGNEGLAKLLDGYEDKSGYAQCVLSFSVGPGQEIKTFVGSTDGTIVYPQGPQGFGWDPIFMPLGHQRTFAEMDREEKNKLSHRFKAFREFKAFVKQTTGL